MRYSLFVLLQIRAQLLLLTNARKTPPSGHPLVYLFHFAFAACVDGLEFRQSGNETMAETPSDVTQMLLAWSSGEPVAEDSLFHLVYDELKRIAGQYLKREREGHTLQPTALVHEAYLRLIDQTRVNWQNRAQFYGVAATMMRRILVNHARAHATGQSAAARPEDCLWRMCTSQSSRERRIC